MMEEVAPRGVLLVLVSWVSSAPPPVQGAVAALARGLADTGHRPVVATAAAQSASADLPGIAVEQLKLDDVTFPCHDDVLRRAVTWQDTALARQLGDMITRHRVDTVLFTDALWGLGRLRGAFPGHVRRALGAHVKPAVLDAGPALARATRIIVPSEAVRAELAGWSPDNVHIVPGPAEGAEPRSSAELFLAAVS